MQKAILIVGATAVGKTSLSLRLAKHFKSAVISADSVHVYKKLSIISGKDIPKNSRFVSLKNKFKRNSKYYYGYYLVDGVPIYAINLAEASRSFSVSEFFSTALLYLNLINEQKKLPFITGGSGLYINSVLNPPDTLDIKPNPELRLKLEAYSLENLQKELIRLDKKEFDKLSESDKKNKRRLIRRIEIVMNGRRRMIDDRKKKINLETLIIGLRLNKEKHKKLISERIKERIKLGAVKEARDLFKNYDKLSSQVKNTIGYKELFGYLKGKTSLEEAIKNWEKSETKLIKKQDTWFKKNRKIRWFEADRKDLFEAVKGEIDRFLNT